MSEELVHLTVDRGIATITLDSPHNRNALSSALVAQLGNHLGRTADDDGIRAVVLTHTGGTFCAGADLAEARGGSMAHGTHDLVAIMAAIVESRKPVVCRVAGHVRAGGMGLVGACDVAVAGPGATFGLTEVRLGLAAATVSLVLAPRMSPRALSRSLLTGDIFGGQEAVANGLVTEVSDSPEALDERVGAYEAAFRAASPQGLRESKALANRSVRAAISADDGAMAELSARLFDSAEAREGMRSFLERRPPSWALG